MKALVLVTAVTAVVALAITPAEAAKKRNTTKEPRTTVAKSDPHLVRDYDGHVLGRDPDPFIRLMIAREGKIRDQHAQ
jgi:hypothetical protein